MTMMMRQCAHCRFHGSYSITAYARRTSFAKCSASRCEALALACSRLNAALGMLCCTRLCGQRRKCIANAARGKRREERQRGRASGCHSCRRQRGNARVHDMFVKRLPP